MSIAVLDFGSQYTRLIARRIRELHVHSVILPGTASIDRIRRESPQGIVLSGGPKSVFEADAPVPDDAIYNLDVPILGICYGMQLLTARFGGDVRDAGTRSYGGDELVHYEGELFAGLHGNPTVWMSHASSTARLPDGWTSIAATPHNRHAAIASPDGRRFGVQFHPEVVHTPDGSVILSNFLDIAGAQRSWTAERNLERMIHEVRERVENDRVLVGVSGGVDSSALALLLARADVPHRAVFVDHGLLRTGERQEVESALHPLGVNLHTVDAADRFFDALQSVVDPEEKRRTIGREFIRVFQAEAECTGPYRYLAQGTLYPDVIESAGGEGAANIKSHHNVGGLPEDLGFDLLEPFRALFKDEVREIAELLGLPDAIRMRHPFPGPGLAIRVLGEANRDTVDLVRRADDIFITTLRESGTYDDVWQALAVLTPARSVGVAGDERRYGHVVALRAVTSVDAMTADWARLPYDVLDRAAQRITREIPEIGRVVFDITSKPPATIEWE